MNEIEKLTPEEMAEFKKYLKEKKEGQPPSFEEAEVEEYTTEIGEYKGSKTIALLLGDKRIMGFGLKKAVAIVECMAAIKQFVDSNKEE